MPREKNEVERKTQERESEQKKRREEEKLDEELKQTFPASDPLSNSRLGSDKKVEK